MDKNAFYYFVIALLYNATFISSQVPPNNPQFFYNEYPYNQNYAEEQQFQPAEPRSSFNPQEPRISEQDPVLGKIWVHPLIGDQNYAKEKDIQPTETEPRSSFDAQEPTRSEQGPVLGTFWVHPLIGDQNYAEEPDIQPTEPRSSFNPQEPTRSEQDPVLGTSWVHPLIGDQNYADERDIQLAEPRSSFNPQEPTSSEQDPVLGTILVHPLIRAATAGARAHAGMAKSLAHVNGLALRTKANARHRAMGSKLRYPMRPLHRRAGIIRKPLNLYHSTPARRGGLMNNYGFHGIGNHYRRFRRGIDDGLKMQEVAFQESVYQGENISSGQNYLKDVKLLHNLNIKSGESSVPCDARPVKMKQQLLKTVVQKDYQTEINEIRTNLGKLATVSSGNDVLRIPRNVIVGNVDMANQLQKEVKFGDVVDFAFATVSPNSDLPRIPRNVILGNDDMVDQVQKDLNFGGVVDFALATVLPNSDLLRVPRKVIVGNVDMTNQLQKEVNFGDVLDFASTRNLDTGRLEENCPLSLQGKPEVANARKSHSNMKRDEELFIWSLNNFYARENLGRRSMGGLERKPPCDGNCTVEIRLSGKPSFWNGHEITPMVISTVTSEKPGSMKRRDRLENLEESSANPKSRHFHMFHHHHLKPFAMPQHSHFGTPMDSFPAAPTHITINNNHNTFANSISGNNQAQISQTGGSGGTSLTQSSSSSSSMSSSASQFSNPHQFFRQADENLSSPYLLEFPQRKIGYIQRSVPRLKRSLPLMRLMVDPNAKLDMTKTLENVGTIARNSLDDRRAPAHHVKNMMGSVRDAMLSTMKIAPHGLIIPSQYKIVDTTKDMVMKPQEVTDLRARVERAEKEVRTHRAEAEAREELVKSRRDMTPETTFGRNFASKPKSLRELFDKFKRERFPQKPIVNEARLRQAAFAPRNDVRSSSPADEDDPYNFLGTFQKVGSVLRESIKSGQDAMEHMNNAAHSARKAYTTSKLAIPRLLIPASRAPVLQKKMTLIAPRFMDVDEDAQSKERGDYVRMGEILDAVGLSNPTNEKVGLKRIVIQRNEPILRRTLPQSVTRITNQKLLNQPNNPKSLVQRNDFEKSLLGSAAPPLRQKLLQRNNLNQSNNPKALVEGNDFEKSLLGSATPPIQSRFSSGEYQSDEETTGSGKNLYIISEDIEDDSEDYGDTWRSLQSVKDMVGAETLVDFLDEMKREFFFIKEALKKNVDRYDEEIANENYAPDGYKKHSSGRAVPTKNNIRRTTNLDDGRRRNLDAQTSEELNEEDTRGIDKDRRLKLSRKKYDALDNYLTRKNAQKKKTRNDALSDENTRRIIDDLQMEVMNRKSKTFVKQGRNNFARTHGNTKNSIVSRFGDDVHAFDDDSYEDGEPIHNLGSRTVQNQGSIRTRLSEHLPSSYEDSYENKDKNQEINNGESKRRNYSIDRDHGTKIHKASDDKSVIYKKNKNMRENSMRTNHDEEFLKNRFQNNEDSNGELDNYRDNENMRENSMRTNHDKEFLKNRFQNNEDSNEEYDKYRYNENMRENSMRPNLYHDKAFLKSRFQNKENSNEEFDKYRNNENMRENSMRINHDKEFLKNRFQNNEDSNGKLDNYRDNMDMNMNMRENSKRTNVYHDQEFLNSRFQNIEDSNGELDKYRDNENMRENSMRTNHDKEFLKNRFQNNEDSNGKLDKYRDNENMTTNVYHDKEFLKSRFLNNEDSNGKRDNYRDYENNSSDEEKYKHASSERRNNEDIVNRINNENYSDAIWFLKNYKHIRDNNGDHHNNDEQDSDLKENSAEIIAKEENLDDKAERKRYNEANRKYYAKNISDDHNNDERNRDPKENSKEMIAKEENFDDKTERRRYNAAKSKYYAKNSSDDHNNDKRNRNPKENSEEMIAKEENLDDKAERIRYNEAKSKYYARNIRIRDNYDDHNNDERNRNPKENSEKMLAKEEYFDDKEEQKAYDEAKSKYFAKKESTISKNRRRGQENTQNKVHPSYNNGDVKKTWKIGNNSGNNKYSKNENRETINEFTNTRGDDSNNNKKISKTFKMKKDGFGNYETVNNARDYGKEIVRKKNLDKSQIEVLSGHSKQSLQDQLKEVKIPRSRGIENKATKLVEINNSEDFSRDIPERIKLGKEDSYIKEPIQVKSNQQEEDAGRGRFNSAGDLNNGRYYENQHSYIEEPMLVKSNQQEEDVMRGRLYFSRDTPKIIKIGKEYSYIKVPIQEKSNQQQEDVMRGRFNTTGDLINGRYYEKQHSYIEEPILVKSNQQEEDVMRGRFNNAGDLINGRYYEKQADNDKNYSVIRNELKHSEEDAKTERKFNDETSIPRNREEEQLRQENFNIGTQNFKIEEPILDNSNLQEENLRTEKFNSAGDPVKRRYNEEKVRNEENGYVNKLKHTYNTKDDIKTVMSNNQIPHKEESISAQKPSSITETTLERRNDGADPFTKFRGETAKEKYYNLLNAINTRIYNVLQSRNNDNMKLPNNLAANFLKSKSNGVIQNFYEPGVPTNRRTYDKAILKFQHFNDADYINRGNLNGEDAPRNLYNTEGIKTYDPTVLRETPNNKIIGYIKSSNKFEDEKPTKENILFSASNSNDGILGNTFGNKVGVLNNERLGSVASTIDGRKKSINKYEEQNPTKENIVFRGSNINDGILGNKFGNKVGVLNNEMVGSVVSTIDERVGSVVNKINNDLIRRINAQGIINGERLGNDRGQTNIGRGQTNIGRGQTNIGRGQTNIGRGQTNIGRGQTNIGNFKSKFNEKVNSFNNDDIGRGTKKIYTGFMSRQNEEIGSNIKKLSNRLLEGKLNDRLANLNNAAPRLLFPDIKGLNLRNRFGDNEDSSINEKVNSFAGGTNTADLQNILTPNTDPSSPKIIDPSTNNFGRNFAGGTNTADLQNITTPNTQSSSPKIIDPSINSFGRNFAGGTNTADLQSIYTPNTESSSPKVINLSRNSFGRNFAGGTNTADLQNISTPNTESSGPKMSDASINSFGRNFAGGTNTADLQNISTPNTESSSPKIINPSINSFGRNYDRNLEAKNPAKRFDKKESTTPTLHNPIPHINLDSTATNYELPKTINIEARNNLGETSNTPYNENEDELSKFLHDLFTQTEDTMPLVSRTKNHEETVGAGLNLPKNLLKPFMNQATKNELNQYFSANGDSLEDIEYPNEEHLDVKYDKEDQVKNHAARYDNYRYLESTEENYDKPKLEIGPINSSKLVPNGPMNFAVIRNLNPRIFNNRLIKVLNPLEKLPSINDDVLDHGETLNPLQKLVLRKYNKLTDGQEMLMPLEKLVAKVNSRIINPPNIYIPILNPVIPRMNTILRDGIANGNPLFYRNAGKIVDDPEIVVPGENLELKSKNVNGQGTKQSIISGPDLLPRNSELGQSSMVEVDQIPNAASRELKTTQKDIEIDALHLPSLLPHHGHEVSKSANFNDQASRFKRSECLNHNMASVVELNQIPNAASRELKTTPKDIEINELHLPSLLPHHGHEVSNSANVNFADEASRFKRSESLNHNMANFRLQMNANNAGLEMNRLSSPPFLQFLLGSGYNEEDRLSSMDYSPLTQLTTNPSSTIEPNLPESAHQSGYPLPPMVYLHPSAAQNYQKSQLNPIGSRLSSMHYSPLTTITQLTTNPSSTIELNLPESAHQSGYPLPPMVYLHPSATQNYQRSQLNPIGSLPSFDGSSSMHPLFYTPIQAQQANPLVSPNLPPSIYSQFSSNLPLQTYQSNIPSSNLPLQTYQSNIPTRQDNLPPHYSTNPSLHTKPSTLTNLPSSINAPFLINPSLQADQIDDITSSNIPPSICTHFSRPSPFQIFSQKSKFLSPSLPAPANLPSSINAPFLINPSSQVKDITSSNIPPSIYTQFSRHSPFQIFSQNSKFLSPSLPALPNLPSSINAPFLTNPSSQADQINDITSSNIPPSIYTQFSRNRPMQNFSQNSKFLSPSSKTSENLEAGTFPAPPIRSRAYREDSGVGTVSSSPNVASNLGPDVLDQQPTRVLQFPSSASSSMRTYLEDGQPSLPNNFETMQQFNTSSSNSSDNNNGSKKYTKNIGQLDNFNNSSLVSAINPEMYKKMFNETLQIDPNSTITDLASLFDSTLEEKANLDGFDPDPVEEHANLESANPGVDEEDKRTIMKFHPKLLKPYMGKIKFEENEAYNPFEHYEGPYQEEFEEYRGF